MTGFLSLGHGSHLHSCGNRGGSACLAVGRIAGRQSRTVELESESRRCCGPERADGSKMLGGRRNSSTVHVWYGPPSNWPAVSFPCIGVELVQLSMNFS